VEPGFVNALARVQGVAGPGDRTAIMRLIFGGELPDAVLARSSKATFEGVFWSRYSREFISQWDGKGVDESVVDPQALLEELRRPVPMAATSALLQDLWLQRDRGERGD
jgi:asparagine synthase (glutamine-hydrolysing)